MPLRKFQECAPFYFKYQSPRLDKGQGLSNLEEYHFNAIWSLLETAHNDLL